MTARGWAVASSLLAPVALIGGWTLAAAARPGFDQARQTISALAAVGAPHRWIMTAGLAVVGVCHVVTAVGLTGARPAGRVLLAVGGVGTAAVAAVPDPLGGHAIAAAVAFGALSVWPAVAGAPGRRSSWAATAVLVACLAGFGWSLQAGHLVGLTERVLAGAQVCWPAIAVLARRPPPG
ncbi:DUF998 domain-containing protein [Actinokineospora pegani]|uniref:DUF998 domain-containing protein n=1 Tax=Actinokineospora pegani TaxID=2654637 RepID=UPI0012EA3811|nr:DUF998 domain-containing protein [Actinokineospora pegani]